MREAAKILEFTRKKPQTMEGVRAALAAIIDDIRSGDATVVEAKPIKKALNKRMRDIRAQMESEKLEDKAVCSGYFSVSSHRHALQAALLSLSIGRWRHRVPGCCLAKSIGFHI